MIFIPVFDSKNIPALFKVGMSFVITAILFPVLELNNIPFITEAIPLVIRITGEIILGVLIGFSVKLTFAGIQLAGQLIGFQMGFAIANVIDPITSSQASIISMFMNIIAMLMFLTVNAHHWFLRALVESFHMVPPFGFQFNGSLMEQLTTFAGDMFVIAIKVGAPVIAALLLTTVALGLIARTVPQMNIFIVAMPIKIVVGLLFLGLSLPFLSSLFKQIFTDIVKNIFFLLKAMV